MSNKPRRIILITAILLIIALFAACQESNIVQPVAEVTAMPEPTMAVAQQIIPVVTEEPIDNEKLAEMNSILRRSTYLEGTRIEGIDIGGKTIQEAKALLEDTVNTKKSSFVINLIQNDQTFTLTSEKIPLIDNLEDVLNEAFNLVREDIGYDAVIQQAREIKENGKDFEVQLEFEPITLKIVIDEYADIHDILPTDASVGYDKDLNQIKYVKDAPGQLVDREAMVAAVQSAKNGDDVEVITVETEAEIKLKDIENTYVKRGAANTNFSGSTSNRKYNIKKGSEMMTGTILAPGEVFSCNDKLGVRSKKNGWKMAGAYEGGEVVQQAGGGVCQLSSTLYNAVVKADLEIVERRNHSMAVSYIDQGLDATINSVGNIIDFKFKNNTDGDIIVIAYTNGNTLYFEIYGKPFATDEYDTIKLRSKKIKTLYPSGEKQVVVDESKPAGYREESKKAKNGSVWKSYKMYYKNGELVKEEELDTSTYKAYSGTITVGPDKGTEDTPKPTSTNHVTETPQPTPTGGGSDNPTESPTEKPTENPTEKPTEAPTEKPTEAPTEKPTEKPTEAPTEKPTEKPTEAPTE